MTRFVLGAFEAVLGGYPTEALLEMLKTGGFRVYRRGDLQLGELRLPVKIGGAGWRQEFVRHPQGFGREFAPEDTQELARLNQLRQRLIGPLERFAARTKDATGSEISQATYMMLMAYGMEENLPALLSGFGRGRGGCPGEEAAAGVDLLMRSWTRCGPF